MIMRGMMPSSRILLSLDDRAVGREVQSLLVRLGYSVPALARPGGETLEQVEELAPDLVMIDAQARGAIRTGTWIDERFGLPIVFLAEAGTDLSLARVPFLCGHLTKPLEEKHLKLALEAALNLRGAPSRKRLKTQTLYQTLERLSHGVMVTDLAGNVAYLNRRAEKMTGWEQEEAAGLPFSEVFRKSEDSKLKRRDGTVIPVEEETAPLENEDGGLSGVVTIFQEKATEAEIRRLQQLESLGFLARGFAHDFNNLLTVLLGNLSMAQTRVTSDQELAFELEQVSGATMKAQSLVQQLMTFARGGKPIKAPIDLKALLKRILSDRERNGIAYELDANFPDAVVLADPKQLRRLIENLLRNAEQSMEEGTVRVRGEALEALFQLEIRDSGHGMEPEVMGQAFEPFYTTRSEMNASGLGLTVCESIARAHDGSIALSSTPENGTVATLRLPLATEEQTMSNPTSTQGSSPAPADGSRILVLEDDALISRLIKATLSQAGYDVTETTEGQQTIETYQQAAASGDPYTLLIMDLTIERGMGGIETMNRIKEINPNARGIVSSGYSDDPAMARPDEFGFSGVLPKPYEPQELVEVVGKVLAS